MKNKPKVKPGDWIAVGPSGRIEYGGGPMTAVVSHVYEDEDMEADVEVVHLDDKDAATNDDVKWTGKRWDFVNSGPSGGYADNYDRLREYVRILRTGSTKVRRK